MIFQQAIEGDINEILEINQRYLRSNLPDTSKGFLLGERSSKWIAENINKYYVVKEENLVLGYAEIDFKIEVEDFAVGTWENEDLKKTVLGKVESNKFIYLIQIATREQRKGIYDNRLPIDDPAVIVRSYWER